MRYRVGEGRGLGVANMPLKNVLQGRAQGPAAGRDGGADGAEKAAAGLARPRAARVSALKPEALGRCEALWGKRNSVLSMFSLSCWQNIQVEIACARPGI